MTIILLALLSGCSPAPASVTAAGKPIDVERNACVEDVPTDRLHQSLAACAATLEAADCATSAGSPDPAKTAEAIGWLEEQCRVRDDGAVSIGLDARVQPGVILPQPGEQARLRDCLAFGEEHVGRFRPDCVPGPVDGAPTCEALVKMLGCAG